MDYNLDVLSINNNLITHVEENIIEENIYNWNYGMRALNIFLENPFYILGLPSDADYSTVINTINKYEKMSKLNVEINTEYDFIKLNNVVRNIDLLQTALFEVQNYPYGLMWIKNPYFNDDILIIDCLKSFFKSKYNIYNFEYDDFIVSYFYLILNDPICNNVYHWIYVLRMISQMYLAGNGYWDIVQNERTKILIERLTTNELKDSFIRDILEPISTLIKGAIRRNNFRMIRNWYYTLIYSGLDSYLIEEFIIDIRDAVDDVLADTYKGLDIFFSKMIEDYKHRIGIDVIPLNKLAEKIDDLLILLTDAFNIIQADTQKGLRVRKPIFKILRLVANIYLREERYQESKIVLKALAKCVYDDSSREQLESDVSICKTLSKKQ